MKAKRLPSPPYNPGVRDLIAGKRAAAPPGSPSSPATKQAFLGWHEHGYLPHRDEPGLTQFLTYRLADSLPAELRSEWEALLRIESNRQRALELEAYLGRGRGFCYLRQPAIAKIVEDSLRFRHEIDYDLLAWVVMPNHVHLLVRVRHVPLARLVGSWKGYSATAANKLLQRQGPFWEQSYWDTYMRDTAHETQTRRYIENNPVKAKLVSTPAEWPWSSARFRDASGRLCLP